MSRSNQRTAYGQALVELGARNPNVVVLDADLCKSTQSVMFQEAYPNRFFEMGIIFTLLIVLFAVGKISSLIRCSLSIFSPTTLRGR